MKQGGLDTLADLCGGASKAVENDKANENLTSLEASSAQNVTEVSSPTSTANSTELTVENHQKSPQAHRIAISKTTTNEQPTHQWQAQNSASTGFCQNHASSIASSIFQAAVQNPGIFQQVPATPVDPSIYMQQFAYYQFIAAAQAQQLAIQQQQNASQMSSQTSSAMSAPNSQPLFPVDPNGATNGISAGYVFSPPPITGQHVVPSDSAQRLSSGLPSQTTQPQQVAFFTAPQIVPGTPAGGTPKVPFSVTQSSMQPPLPPSHVQSISNGLHGNAVLIAAPAVAQRPISSSPPKTNASIQASDAPIAQRPIQEGACMSNLPPDGKKQLKRAANRRSAQLSRKRKKLYIEELKEENDELRRKEQILMSIPDLIVVFDSAGKLGFVSQSIFRFLDFLPEELEGSSFWSRLCEESVRLLKAAFMDALAARKPEMDTAPLGSGVWELRLLDKDGSQKLVTLNGVVHFSGEAPECVCSIRPLDNKTKADDEASSSLITNRALESNSVASIRVVVKPDQSVRASNLPSHGEKSCDTACALAPVKRQQDSATDSRRVISDGDSGSVVSESGSE